MRTKGWQQEEALAAIKAELQRLEDHETLLVQSGRPVAVFETHEAAPRVLIANSNLVPQWATWEHFRKLDAAGLGGMGGAQPLAVTMLDGAALCVEVDRTRIERRLDTGYLDERAADLDDALERLQAAAAEKRGLSIGLLANAAD